MKIKTISVKYGRKFNLQDYNSLALEVTYFADIDEGDDATAIVLQLQDAAREDVRREYGRLNREKSAK